MKTLQESSQDTGDKDHSVRPHLLGANGTMVELLLQRSKSDASRKAYTFLRDGLEKAESISYQDLDRRARTIAAQLQKLGRPGDRVIIAYPSGLDFIATFYGCLYAGMIAVPVCPPHPARVEKNLVHLSSILRDCTARIFASSPGVSGFIHAAASQLKLDYEINCLSVEDLVENSSTAWNPPQLEARTVALLQYTSGTTRLPKGVMISHGNLLHNHLLIQQIADSNSNTIALTWLPFYHDMGLGSTVLQPLFCGGHGIFMNAATFIQNPFRWLAAISKYRATSSTAPNFGYDLCVRKITDEQVRMLDLSCWKVAMCGAEPIRSQTLEQFARKFEPCGFRRRALFPCYGLAEATLIVSGARDGQEPVESFFERDLLQENQAVETTRERGTVLVASGKPCAGTIVEVVGSDGNPVANGKIGEIWVSSGSVAQGYWNNSKATEDSFRAFLADRRGPFLRTGDLGFFKARQLYVTGRLNDIVIIRGRKHYPQDLEYTAERSHPALRADASAVFSVESGGEERLVFVHELNPRWSDDANLDEVLGNIQQAISSVHGLQIGATILLRAGSIPRTTSGKIQRRLCKERFLKDAFAESTRQGCICPALSWVAENRAASAANK